MINHVLFLAILSIFFWLKDGVSDYFIVFVFHSDFFISEFIFFISVVGGSEYFRNAAFFCRKKAFLEFWGSYKILARHALFF